MLPATSAAPFSLYRARLVKSAMGDDLGGLFEWTRVDEFSLEYIAASAHDAVICDIQARPQVSHDLPPWDYPSLYKNTYYPWD